MIGPRGLALVKQYESLRLEAYLCPAGIPTVGYGHTHLVKLGGRCTEAEADAMLAQDIAACESVLDYQVTVPLTESMRDALLSLVYNLGGGNFRISTLRRRLNAQDYAGCPAEFRRWNKARNPETGWLVALDGLTARREAEAELFMADGLPGGASSTTGS